MKRIIIALSLIICLVGCNPITTIDMNSKEDKKVKLVPSLSDDFPDYYAKCNKCGHIWKTQTEEMCECGNFDNVEYYEQNLTIKNSELYEALNQYDLLYADIDQDIMTITIGFRDGTFEYHKYKTNEDFDRDYYILWELCGPAEYIYHGYKEAEIDLGDGSAKLDETKNYPHRDIIYYINDEDRLEKNTNNEVSIITKDNFIVSLPCNS